jgi:hypothetical protein
MCGLWLDGIRRFAEPCCGAGDLVRHLEGFGLICVAAGDIATGQDALALGSADLARCEAIITNPPHRRDVMHALIRHFLGLGAPAWLLLDWDWAANRQAAPYLPACSDIVPIGRLKWIAGSRDTGKANYAWYRFEGQHVTGPRLHPRGAVAVTRLPQGPGKRPETQRSNAA